jgi:hypothetical protein
MLQRMYTERLISAEHAAAFESSLSEHQRAVGSDGSTLFGKAVIEHNVAAASRIYASISFTKLGELLGLAPEKVRGLLDPGGALLLLLLHLPPIHVLACVCADPTSSLSFHFSHSLHLPLISLCTG